MCGIVGFTGNNEAAPILLDGLSKLEYRGYDSAGIAVRNGDAEPEIVKAKGKLKVLKEMTNDGKAVKGACGIGHTRWATHGEPSTVNAHPHCSDDENVIAVHNGIIENYQELREKLIKKGYTFKSETDTEVAVKLIDYYYKKYLGTPVDALNHALVRIRGSYALAVMFKDYPGEIYAARKDSPMIIGVTGGESYLASDVPAILKYTRNVYYIGNMELGIETSIDGDIVERGIIALNAKIFSVSIVTSLSGSFLTISEKIFAFRAIIPRSTMSPSIDVSMPSSISFAVSFTTSVVASIRIHSRIGMVVLDGTAFETMLTPFTRFDFVQIIFI